MPITDQGMSGKPGGDTGNPGIAIPPPPLKKAKGKKGEIKLNPIPKNLKDIVDISPKTTYAPEAKEKHAVMTFGRMNPPTTGHEKLIHATHKVARKMGTKAHIVLSHSHDKKNNPLPQKHKINYVKKIHPGVHVTGSDKQNPSFLHHAKKLHQAGHDHLHMVAGSDRTKDYHKILHKYNGHPDHYNFKSITVHSAGQRDPDSHGTAGISGTKMRAHAHAGDHKSFKAGLPKSLHGHAQKIMGHIKEEYEDVELLEWFDTLSDEAIEDMIVEDYIQEELVNERVMTLLQRRKAGIKMRRLKFRIQRARKMKKKRMATKDMLVRRARRQARTVIRKRLGGAKGAKYSALSPSERIQLDKRVQSKQAIINKIAIRLLPKVKSAELKRLSAARGKKNESVNHSFERFIADVVHEGTSENNNRWSFQEYLDNTSTGLDEAEGAKKIAAISDKHQEQDKRLDKRQDLAKERLKIQISRQKSAEIRREALNVAETVDMMIEAIEAIDAKAIKAQLDPDTLFVEYIEGYENPHGKQTPQQGGFAAVNKLIAEMSQAQKDKAEDIVKGMKKKASDFTKRYGDKGEQVMYATANKLAQEDYKSLKSFGEREILRDLDEKSKGLWANIHAKRKRGEKMNPKGHPDAPSPAEMKKAQNEDYSAMKDAQAHAKKDGANYDRDVSVQHKYDAYHMKKRGYTHRKYNSYGSYEYNKHGSGNKITSADHHGISEEVDNTFVQKRGKQLSPQEKARANKQYRQKARDEIKAKIQLARKVNEAFQEAVGAAYMPDAGAVGTPEREITSKAVKKQINRNANRSKMKGKVQNPEVRYVQDRNRKDDLTAAQKKKSKKTKKGDTHDKIHKTKKKKEVEEGYYADKAAKQKETLAKHDKRMIDSARASIKKFDSKPKVTNEGGNAGWEAFRKRVGKDLRDKVVKGRKADKSKVKQHDNKEIEEGKNDSTAKMTQLFRMGLAKKGELELMKRAMKRGPDALKDPKLRGKLYELLQKLVGIVTTDGQIFVKLRQNVQNSKDELQAVEELFKYMSNTIVVQDIDLVNAHFEDLLESININEDMSGMSVKSGHKRSVDSGAGMTKKGVEAYKRRNPGSKLKTAVTTPPSKLKAGSKAAGRRKAFCARSRSWDGERGRAARRRWNC